MKYKMYKNNNSKGKSRAIPIVRLFLVKQSYY